MRGLAVFLILFSVWLVFSGHFDLLHLSLGLVCSAIVTALSGELLFPAPPSARTGRAAWRIACYVPWLLYEVVVANLHVVSLVCRPSHLRPQVVRIRTGLTGDLARVALANSITLTPGTITMDIEDDVLTVHAISDHAAAGLWTGEMERRVAHAFLEAAPAGAPGAAPPR